jgi:hypothetical protein
MHIQRSGKKVPFLDLGIGSPFYAHGRVWVRTDFDAATELKGSEEGAGASTCNFLIDGTVKSVRAAPGTVCEEVETVEIRPLKLDRENDEESSPPGP